ncbi:VOC family protein [Devosia sediminis]|uniref:VOC family protein n=1 Tax=Devosia sediminis TaxID=2798801 RepID=A0A934MJ65_9HYPH|nr:VOC family protein [Devosia sediminis]MBJ3786962.1 VOC family protein [Devosia sediminis]
MYKPQGYTSVSPYLIVDNAQATLAFIKAVFDAEPHAVHHGEDGSVAHAEVWIDDTVLMFGEWKGSGAVQHVHVYVPDVLASFEKARQAGGKAVQKPVRKDDPDLRGGIVDPSGTTWWLSTRQA